MDKPQIKRELVVSERLVLPALGMIFFYASSDAKEDLIEFGEVENAGRLNYYKITIDMRYDFNEVLEYMLQYDSEVK